VTSSVPAPRKRLGVSRASLGSLSESVAIFDPATLREIAVELGHTIRSKPHESHRGMQGPSSDGVLRIVTDRLDLPAELIAEMVRLRWIIEMFFRTFKQLLGCKHLFSDKHNGVEIQA